MNIVILDPRWGRGEWAMKMSLSSLYLFLFLFHFNVLLCVCVCVDHFVKSLLDLLQYCSCFVSCFVLATRRVGSQVPDQGWNLCWQTKSSAGPPGKSLIFSTLKYIHKYHSCFSPLVFRKNRSLNLSVPQVYHLQNKGAGLEHVTHKGWGK